MFVPDEPGKLAKEKHKLIAKICKILKKSFVILAPGPNVIGLFTTIIYNFL
jgi:hypothetical protein